MIYITGKTPDGVSLIGGVWTEYSEAGMPIEMSYLNAKTSGFAVDWMEAIFDASRTNNLPAIYKSMCEFLDADTLTEIKIRFSLMASQYTPDEVLKMKRGEA